MKWKVTRANICQSPAGDEVEETILPTSELVDFAFPFALQGSRIGKLVFRWDIDAGTSKLGHSTLEKNKKIIRTHI